MSVQNSYIEIYSLDVMVFEVQALGALMNEISTLVKETPENCPAPSAMCVAVRRQPSINQEAGSHQTRKVLVSGS